MLTEFNQWALVVGSDSPTFVLYENGTVIYVNEKNRYVSAKLTPAEVEAFVRGLGRDTMAGLTSTPSSSHDVHPLGMQIRCKSKCVDT
jgi:hypothetical protein